MKEHLEAIAIIVGKFLIKHGGWSNGVDTWAEGYVYSDSSCVEISIHNDSLTLRELRNLGNELAKLIQNYKLKHKIPYGIKLSKSHIEWGSYSTYVSYIITDQAQVPLYSYQMK